MNNRHHYKSWSSLNQQLTGLLCDSLRGRIRYFFTRYAESGGNHSRAAILLDEKELVQFSWDMECRQCMESAALYRETGSRYPDSDALLRPDWVRRGLLGDGDFMNAVSAFRDLSIANALISDDYIVRIFAILDRRCGKRTLERLIASRECDSWPDWAKQFAYIRFESEGLLPERRVLA